MTSSINQLLHDFLNLEKESREAKDLRELSFIICNLSKKIIDYNQALIWRKTKTGVYVYAISSIANINRKSPYVHWLEKQLIPYLLNTEPKKFDLIKLKNVPEYLHREWKESLPGHIISYPFKSIDNKEHMAGIIFAINEEWLSGQKDVADELFNHYQHCWQRLEQREKKRRIDKLWFNRRRNLIKAVFLIIIFLMLLIPVQQTIITPAKIAPKEPLLISSSIDGIINKIYVQPNDKVKKGQLLFSLDKITLINEVEQATKDATIARERYRRAYQHAYNNPESKAELAVLKSEVERSESILQYRQQVLDRSDIRAQHNGIIIFSSPKYWLGKPIKIGEQVMLLAEENKKQLDADVPQSDMIEVAKGNKVLFYPNIDPLNPVKAKINYASYVATPSSEGELTYFIACDFTSTKKIPRFGSQGSAKIYGEKVSLFFYLFRRPIIFIQSLLGV